MNVEEAASSEVVTALDDLTSALRSVDLTLDLGDVEAARRARDELADQVGDYLIPRLQRLDAPLLAVLGGSTGSGKSTITNTLVGRQVSAAGVLRPTTRAPVLVCHPEDGPWFTESHVLPDLARVTIDRPALDTDPPTPVDAGQGTVLQIVTDPGLDAGLAIIDAPDIDSIEEANRDLATQLLAAADLWLFATSAVRYADAVPWEFLRQARSRGTSLAIIINRIPPGASDEVVPHLESMLAEADLVDVPVFPIETVDQADMADGMLPAAAVVELRRLLIGLATDAERRAEVVRATLDGALDSVGPRAREVAAASREQDEAVASLRAALERAYGDAAGRFSADVDSGNLLRGEVLDRWQELVGTAELMQAVQSRISMIRDRIGSFFSGRPAATAEVQGEITSTMEQLLIDYADGAAAAVVTSWRNLPGGAQVIGDDRSLDRSSEAFRAAAAGEVRGWQDDILDLVRERGAGKRTTARILAFGINSIGIALMIVLFSQTGGLTGGEVAISAGTAGLSQTLLSALFGEQAVRELATEAKKLLIDRVSALLDQDGERFLAKLGQRSSGDLGAAIERFERAR